MNEYGIDEWTWSNFVDYFPPDFDEIEDVQEVNQCEIMILYKDGTRYIFNDRTSSIRRLPLDPEDMTDDEVIFEFMQRFRSMRVLRSYTLTDLYEMTGISLSTLSRYENGEGTPTVVNLRKLAKAFRCTLDDLVLMEYND